MHFNQLHPEEERQRVATAFQALKQRGEGVLTDTLILRKDGVTIPVDLLGNVITYKNNKVMMGVFRDTSERKKIDQMKDNLIRDVTHELKTPIAMMEMALSMQRQAIDARDYEEIRNAWRIGSRNLKTLRKDVNNVLKMYSLGAKMVVPQPRQMSLKRMTAEIVRDLRDLTEQKKLRIEMDIPPELDKIHADEKMIRTLIYNIIENAIKFTKHGAIYVTMHATEKELFLKVRDTGCGLNLKDKSVLFTRFFKQDPSIQGTGLGLPICKEIVAIYGGSIEVESEGAGKGTTVTVKLPRAALRK
jgi:signal transduction histidine kinase